MDCQDVRSQLQDLKARRLTAASRDEVRAHISSCSACARVEAAERTLDEALERRLPRYGAPRALARRLGLHAAPVAARILPGGRRWTRFAAPALAAGFAALSTGLLVERAQVRRADATAALAAEAVNDHLRQLVRAQPLEIQSGGMHQVKPWFEGRLDFAPVVPVLEGEDLRLQGGAVGYFLDRKAACIAYALRQHAVTLFVFRADGLPWPGPTSQVGRVELTEASQRGFNVFLWKSGGLGYALVADVNAEELAGWAARLTAAGAP
jgi:anti-sigma factor RsiW